MQNVKLIIYSTLLLSIAACGPGDGLYEGANLLPEEYSVDAVKLIQSSVSRYDDPAAYSQTRYTLQKDARLLLRFENLKDHTDDIMKTDKDIMELQISLDTAERYKLPEKPKTADPNDKPDDPKDKKASDDNVPPIPPTLKAAMESIKLCPLTKAFMMLSTWFVIHPFGTEGKWNNPGSDYDDTSCGLASKVEDQHLIFDIKKWYIDYAKGRGVNYGFVLISDPAFTILGDQSGSYSPRIRWTTHTPVKWKKNY